MKLRLIILSLMIFAFLSQGCLSQIATFEEGVKSTIRRPLSELKEILARPASYPSRIGWQEETYKLDNGNMVYVEPVRPDCFIHWEVNPEGIITGYKTEGKRCY